MTPDEQISQLRPSLSVAAKMRLWFIGIALLALSAALIFWNSIPLFFGLFFTVVGLADRYVAPNIIEAIRAYDTQPHTEGEVTVSITQWDMDLHYRANIKEMGHSEWVYDFIPQGWKPEARSYKARIWRNTKGIPLLAIVDVGILIPRGLVRPKANKEKLS